MNYYNDFSSFNNQGYPNQLNVPTQNQSSRFDINQFNQLVSTLNDESLRRLVSLAQYNGISNVDIQNGLNYINSLRV